MEYKTLCVLNDGTTYTDINGCKLILVTEEHYTEMVEGSGDLNDLSPLAIVDLSSLAIVPRL
jgi:hypothetical protein